MMHSVLLMLLLVLPASISTLAAAKADDEAAAALLAFKAAAFRGNGNGGGDALASWNSSSTGGLCSWEGVSCRGKHRRVVALKLPSRSLTGLLSPSIGNLSSLRTINLSNNGFTGDIPRSLGRLHHLRTLDLSHNAFSGELPSNLRSCTVLEVIALQFNQLRGRVPTELGGNLKVLILSKNGLTGTIPPSLANLSSLTYLSLGFNQLEGTIPPGLGGIPGLRFLDVAYNNLSGDHPRSLYNLSSLEMLEIQGNRLHGVIPADIGSSFPSMSALIYADNLFTGPIPSSLSNLTALQELVLSQNSLSGYVPRTLGRLRALRYLFLFGTILEADGREGWEFIASLSNCSQLQQLLVGSNDGFTGELPSAIVNLSTTLQMLRFDETMISGSIPSSIGNLVNLTVFSVANTFISGVIPKSIGKLSNLVKLGLFNTNLSGQIPSSIGNLSELIILEAHNGNLEGTVPASIGNMSSLLKLDLSMNHLNGVLPREIFKLPVISVYLNLSYNSLSGPLPSEVGSFGNLNSLVLSGNQFSGEIPVSIGKCTVLQQLRLDNNAFEGSIPQSLNNIKGLTVLNLSMNMLSGSIPDAIQGIQNLQVLYLAHKNLSGPIPLVVETMKTLSKLDLSFNNLQGEVPKEGNFRNPINFSVAGNKELCGGIPQLHLTPCHMVSVKKNRKEKLKPLTITLTSIGALSVLALLITLFRFIYKKFRRKHDSQFLPSKLEEQYERVSYHELVNGTNGFSEANLLGKGGFGEVYKCTFHDERTLVAVKVFNLEQSGSTRSFVAECEALRRVRHRCLIKTITCCSSINLQGHEFKALVFEFMPNGSLNDWLHPKYDQPTLSNTLSLEQRLDIAVDIMDAFDYLHNHCQPSIVHCDVKPSNILLAENMRARVGDFGMSRILPEFSSNSLQNSNRTVGIRGSIGYVAPEYGEGSSASTLGNIYSIGILLLEMFTGRSPTDDMFEGSLDLHKFAEEALPERVWDIVDSTMWLHTNAYGNTARSIIQYCLVSVIALGTSCSKKQPKERIPIMDAAIEMHAIRDSYIKFAKSHVVDNEAAM